MTLTVLKYLLSSVKQRYGNESERIHSNWRTKKRWNKKKKGTVTRFGEDHIVWDSVLK